LAEIATFDVLGDPGTVSIRVVPAAGHTFDEVTRRFRTSLIDFALREDIEARTRGMRELIWQTAFGEALRRDRP
jgi:His-Xaa-Ser system protein HxsD